MKKRSALFFLGMMCTVLVACGKSNLTDTTWTGLYSGTKLELKKDGSVEIGKDKGTWTQEDDCITLNYNDGWEIERYADVLEEDETTFINIQENATANGDNKWIFSYADSYYPTDHIEEIKKEIARKVGDTVSTDIVEFTIKKAALSYYATTPITDGIGYVCNINEACEPAENGSLYKTNKGYCLLCIDLVIKNVDRGTLDTRDCIRSLSVNLDGKSAFVNGYDLNNESGSGPTLDLYKMPISFNGEDFTTSPSFNQLLDAGQSMEVKYIGVVSLEPAELSAPFEVVVDIAGSKGNNGKYIYTVE